MADVLIENLVKTYPGNTERATDSISLQVADGEFMVLVGPSGCGKTTLLRMIAGLELPDGGGVAIGGRDVTYLPPNKRNLSMVFQSYAVFPHRRVRYNIGFGLAMAGMPKHKIAEKVDWAADLLQLKPYLDRFPAQLSGGQRQRVAVARAIVVDADVLLMDEPLSNLDALLRMSFRAELKQIVEQIGTTTVYVTHDQVEAMSLGDRVAVMRQGRIAQLGAPVEVYDRPADTFVGGFIGSPPMNFLDGTVTGGELDILGSAIGGSPRLPDGAVTVGIRAESVELAAIDSAGTVSATIDVVEPLGASTLVTAAIGDRQIKVQVSARTTHSPRDRVGLLMEPAALRFFDPESGVELITS